MTWSRSFDLRRVLALPVISLSLTAIPAGAAELALVPASAVPAPAVASGGAETAAVSITIPTDLAPAPVPGESRLTLTQAIDTATRQNPTYQAARQAAISALRNHQALRMPLDPQVSVVSGFDTNLGTFDALHTEDIGLTFVLETSGRRGLRSRASEALYRQALQDVETARQNLRLGVTNAYVALQVANASLEAQTELYRLVARQRGLTEQQFRLGAARENDVIRLQIAQDQAEQALVQARGAVTVARATLNQQLGRTASTPVDAAEKLAYQPLTLDRVSLAERAYANRSELKSEEQAIRNLQVVVSQQRSQYVPDVNFTFRPDALVDRSFNSGNNNILYTAWINFPLPLGSIRHQIRKAQSDVEAEKDRRDAVRTQVALDVETAVTNLLAAQKVVAGYHGGMLARASSLVDRTQKGFEVGGASILDVIDAQTTYRTTLVSYYQAIGNYRQAVAQLERAIGGSLP